MTAFNTCSYPDCTKRIPYEIGEIPAKYCPEHLKQMQEREWRALRDQKGFAAL